MTADKQKTPAPVSQEPQAVAGGAIPLAALQRAINRPRQARPAEILALQRTVGNRAVSRLLANAAASRPRRGIQAKLTVGPADDQYEQEADRVAAQVVGNTQQTVSSKQQAVRRQKDEKEVQTKPLVASITPPVQAYRSLAQRQEDEEEVQTKPLAQRAARAGEDELHLTGNPEGGHLRGPHFFPRSQVRFAPTRIVSPVIQCVRKNKAELLQLTVKQFDDHRKAEQMDWANTPDLTQEQQAIIWAVLDWGVSGLANIKLEEVLLATDGAPNELQYLKDYCLAVNGVDTVQLDVVNDLGEARNLGLWVGKFNQTIGGPRVKATIPSNEFKALIADPSVAQDFLDYYVNQKPMLETPEGKEVWSFRQLVGVEKAKISDYTTDLPEIRNYHKFKKTALDKLKTDRTAPKTIPLMLVLYSMMDHSGAFNRHEEMHKVITDVHSRVLLLEDMNPQRIVNLARGGGLDRLAANYGMEGKITQAVLAGHGSTHSVELAGQDTQMVRGKVAYDKYFPVNFKDKDPNASLWEEFFEALFRNMAAKGGFQPKLLLRACLTNSNEVDVDKLKTFMKDKGIIDLDTIGVDTSTDENQGKIRDGIRQYMAKYGSIATKMQTLAGARATVLGANASITAASTGAIKSTGELSIIALTDPAVDKSKIEYVRHGTEPVGAIKAVIESWARDPDLCFAKMQERMGDPVADNEDFVIHLLYGLIKTSYAKNILGANAFANSADALSGVVKGGAECRVKALMDDPMVQKHAVDLYSALLAYGPIAAENNAKLVIYQAWLLKDESKCQTFADTLGQMNFNRHNAKDYVDVPAIAAKIPTILAAGTASVRGRDLLALIGFIEKGNPDCKNYLVASATGPGQPLPLRIKGELRGYNENGLRKGLGLPEEIIPTTSALSGGGSGGSVPPPQNEFNVSTTGGPTNDYFVQPLPATGKRMTKAGILDRAHIRKAPDDRATSLGSYYMARDFTVVGEVKTKSGVALGWYMVKLDAGGVGYMKTKYFA